MPVPFDVGCKGCDTGLRSIHLEGKPKWCKMTRRISHRTRSYPTELGHTPFPCPVLA